MSISLANDGFLLEGTAYFDRINDAGVSDGLVELAGMSKLEITAAGEIKPIKTKDKGRYNQAISFVPIPKPSEIKIAISNGSRLGVALALMGESQDMSAGGGTITDQPMIAKLGKCVELGVRNITADSVVVTNSAATTTYAEGTDYEINYDLGFFKALVSGDITESQALKLDCAHGAISGWKVRGAVKPSATGRFILDGRNLNNGKAVRFEAYNIMLTTDGAFNLMADDVAEFGLSGFMAIPSGKTEPFIIEQW